MSSPSSPPAIAAWVGRPLRVQRGNQTLFCFACAGGGPTLFRPWGTRMRADIDVRPICLPGRETRRQEPLARRLRPVAEALADAITAAADRPFAFFGHSLGAVIAYEVTLLLRARGVEGPRHLFLAGRSAPGLAPVTARHRFAHAELIDHLRDLGGTPEAVLREPELMDLMLPIVRADLEMLETHEPDLGAPRLEVPISTFFGTRDAYATEPNVNGWRERTAGAFRSRGLEGDHFFVVSRTAEVLRAIEEDLGPAA